MIKQQHTIILSLLLIMVSSLLIGCRRAALVDSDLSSTAAINIRIHNDDNTTIQALYLGAGPEDNHPSTHQTGFRRIAPDAITEYAQIEPDINNYRVSSARYDGERPYIIRTNPATLLGLSELQMGAYYTFKYTREDGDVTVSIVRDK